MENSVIINSSGLLNWSRLIEHDVSILPFPTFVEQIKENLFSLKEELLKKIVSSALGKDNFTTEEVKHFSFVQFEHLNSREFVEFRDNVIGEISMFEKQENFQSKMGFEFQPGRMVMKNGCLQFVPNPELK